MDKSRQPNDAMPDDLLSTSTPDAAYVWVKLAPRLLHPSKLTIIQRLLAEQRPLSPSELAASTEISVEHARYECKAMRNAGVLEVVSVTPRAKGGGDELSYYFPVPSEAPPSPASAREAER